MACAIVRVMVTDPLSDILRLTEAKSVISGGFAAAGAWSIRFPPPREVKFSAVAKGACWLRIDGQRKAVRLQQGDVISLLPGRSGFIIASCLDAPPKDGPRVFDEHRRADTGGLVKIGDGSECVVLAGGVSLQPWSADLLKDALPALIHVRGASPQAATARWIVERLFEERSSTIPGSSIASAQLAQLLFTQILRAHLASSATLPSGWLRAIRDERIAPALQLIHGAPERAWRLSDLAKAAAMSRTSFVLHFKAVAGLAPLAYLTEWRMRLARRALLEHDSTLFEIAQSIGYNSESSFSHAFKRVVGVCPRDYKTEAT